MTVVAPPPPASPPPPRRARGDETVAGAVPGAVPDADDGGGGAGGARPAPDPRRVVAAIGRREASLLLGHPALVVSVVLVAVAWWLDSGDGAVVLFQRDVSAALWLVLAAWGLLLATHLAVLRDRRNDAAELVASLPVTPAARTAGHLLASLVALPLSAALLALWYVVELQRPATTGTPRLAELAVAPLILLGAAVTGVLVARWAPIVVAGPLAVLATIVVQLGLAEGADVRWRQLNFVTSFDKIDPRLDVRDAGWHLVWLAGLVMLGVVLALARHGRSRAVVGGAAAAALVLAVSGFAQSRPVSASELDAMVDWLQNPRDHQRCQILGDAEYCAYAGYEEWVPQWAASVQGVLDRVPPDVLAGVLAGDEPFTVGQRLDPLAYDEALLPVLRDAIDPEALWPTGNGVAPRLGWEFDDEALALAYQAAARVVGLPTALGWGDEACTAGGQARVVVALWLAGQAVPGGATHLAEHARDFEAYGGAALVELVPLDHRSTYEGTDRFPSDPRNLEPDLASGGRGADVVAAAALLARPADEVADAVGGQWDRLVDPDTPAAEVFEALEIAVPTVLDGSVPVTPGIGGACP